MNNRTEFLSMLRLVDKCELDVVVVLRLDRLARDIADATATIKRLNSIGCFLYAGNDVSDQNTASGTFLRNIMLAQNQYQAQQIALSVKNAECHIAAQGRTAGGVPPYGLKVVDKRFEIDETEAPAIRLMFDMIVKNHSYKDVIKELDRLGYKTRNGVRFSYSTLNTTLRNEKYYGTYVYNRKNGKRKKGRTPLNPDSEFEEVRNTTAIQPIVSKKTFDAVQRILEGRKKVRFHQNASSDYVLTGLIYCHNCGASMHGNTETGGRNRQRRRSYICSYHTTKKGKTCLTKSVNADYIERTVKSVVMDNINGYLASADSVSVFDSLKSDMENRIKEYTTRCSQLDTKIHSLVSRAAKSSSEIVIKQYESEVESCVSVKSNLQSEIEELKSRLCAIDTVKAQFRDRKEELKPDDIFTSDGITRTIMRIFIERIEIDDVTGEIIIETK